MPLQVLDRLHSTADDFSQAGIWRMAKVAAAVAAAILIICSVWFVQLARENAGPVDASLWEWSAMTSAGTAVEQSSDEQLAMWIIESAGEQP